MQTRRYRVVVSGTEFFLDVVQTGGTTDVPMIAKQSNREIWNHSSKERMMHNSHHK